MSRIGRLPIKLPAGVIVTVDSDNLVTVKGPKGTLSQKVNKDITLSQEDGTLHVARPSDSKPHRAMHGLYRALISNMVTGVTSGFDKVLVLEGVGYRATAAVSAAEVGDRAEVASASLLGADLSQGEADHLMSDVPGHAEVRRAFGVGAHALLHRLRR